MRARTRNRLLLSAVSALLCLLTLLSAEVLARLFSGMPFFGNSSNLFVANAWGTSFGNSRGIHAMSFGAEVFIDANGFRWDPAYPGATSGPAVLLLGDSVAFGPGVADKDTFAGLLRSRFPSKRIYNSSVMGYDLKDYRNVVQGFLPMHPEVARVYLAFCLNDASHRSAAEIVRKVGNVHRAPEAVRSTPSTPDLDSVEQARRFAFLAKANRFLRARSKLYLFLKYLLTDPAKRYFRADLALYDLPEEDFASILAPLDAIDANLRARGIPFTVVLFPYEFQLRSKDPHDREPQRRLVSHCRAQGIACTDLLDRFAKSPSPSELFLKGDPMHLSGAGHHLAFEVFASDVEDAASETREGGP